MHISVAQLLCFLQTYRCLAAYRLMNAVQVLIIHGQQDRLVPVSNSRRLVQMLPGAELVELSACGHLPHEELPDQFIDTMQKFLVA